MHVTATLTAEAAHSMHATATLTAEASHSMHVTITHCRRLGGRLLIKAGKQVGLLLHLHLRGALCGCGLEGRGRRWIREGSKGIKFLLEVKMHVVHSFECQRS